MRYILHFFPATLPFLFLDVFLSNFDVFASDIRSRYDIITFAYCYQFKVLSDDREGFYCPYVRVMVTKGEDALLISYTQISLK